MGVGGGEKSQKSMRRRGMRPGRGSTATRFISTALRPRYYRRQFFKPRHTAVVRHFRLTAVSRARPAKKGRGCARRRAAMLYHSKSRAWRAYFRCSRFAARKNVPSHRGRVNFQKKKKKKRKSHSRHRA